MVDADRPRFMREMKWLNQKFEEMTGRVFPLPDQEFFDSLKDLPAEDVLKTIRWLWGHAEYYPAVPGALRKWVMAWREAHPRPPKPSSSTRRQHESPVESPESREESSRALKAIMDSLNGNGPPVWAVEDLVGRV